MQSYRELMMARVSNEECWVGENMPWRKPVDS